MLAAAAGLRAPDPSAQTEKTLDAAVRRIVGGLVSVDTSAGDQLDYTAYPAAGGGALDGVMIDATTYVYSSGATRTRTLVALVPVDEALSLGGTLELRAAGASLQRSTLSGDVFVSSPVDTTDAGPLEVVVADETAPSVGQPAPSAPVPRTAAEKAVAKAAYDAALKKARKKYAKAKKKAGTSKRRKAAAKKKYARSRAAAKARFRSAVADVPSAAPPAAPADQRVFRTMISTDTGWVTA
ncbi:hypothetical protein DX116_05510 [Aeromicrobium endophyticum]|uniref:Uncharacterized protein n=1 Tax=Aeromicrobium endophyticum TaxID=2292704 RepID=A0A371PAR6_9ACTN|nr:hypothetical protein DX116_05510 [Aeromicrobium endophyticum]